MLGSRGGRHRAAALEQHRAQYVIEDYGQERAHRQSHQPGQEDAADDSHVQRSEYDDFAWDPTPNAPPFDTTDFSDLDIPFAPQWQVGLDVTYDQDLGNGGVVVYNVNGNYQDEAETSPFDPNAAQNDIVRHPTFTQIEERTLINASITYRDPNDKWYVTLYGRGRVRTH